MTQSFLAFLMTLCLTGFTSAASVSIVNSADTFINSGEPNRNFGDIAFMRVGGLVDLPPNTGFTTPQGERIGLSWFDLSAISPGSVVDSVRFSAFQTDTFSVVAGGFDVFGVASDWSELSVTWNTQPALGDFLFNTGTLYQSSSYFNLNNANLIALVQNWVNAPASNFGLAFKLADYSQNNGDTFATRENLDHFAATLEITSSPIPIPAAVWLFGSSLIGLISLRHAKLLSCSS